MDKNGFFNKLNQAIDRNDSLLCLGIDPEVNQFPQDFMPGAPTVERLTAWCQNLIRQTADCICCVKPNVAFFEQYGPQGLAALQQVIQCVPAHIPILLDAKRGEIGNTAAAYARAVFEVLQADAVTLNPYLGRDSIEPFLNYEGKAVFILCQTSNPSAVEVQNNTQPPLYQQVARLCQTWGTQDQIGLVVGATYPESLAEVRAIAPQNWILAPGVGAQGGDLFASLHAGLRADGLGMIIPVSRAIMNAADPHEVASNLREEINTVRRKIKSQPYDKKNSSKTELVNALFKTGCIQFGEFILASGKQSPIYIDLRRIISFPDVLRIASDAYAQNAANLVFERLAAVPYATLPVTTSLSLQLNIPMIYPRKEVKAYGSCKQIEGAFQPGQKALVVEDVITTGGSILTAIQTLKAGGLVVKDVLVLVDRNQGGRQALEAEGYILHAVLDIQEIVEILYTGKYISPDEYQTVKTYLEKTLDRSSGFPISQLNLPKKELEITES